MTRLRTPERPTPEIVDVTTLIFWPCLHLGHISMRTFAPGTILLDTLDEIVGAHTSPVQASDWNWRCGLAPCQWTIAVILMRDKIVAASQNATDPRKGGSPI